MFTLEDTVGFSPDDDGDQPKGLMGRAASLIDYY